MSSEDVGDLLMVIWQRWRSASPVRKGAITREQYWILRTLAESGGLKVKDLASSIGCTSGSASVAVKRLEKSGLVRRERGRSDERVVTVTLEKQGAKNLDAWKGEQLSAMADLFESLTVAERRTLRDLLAKALAASLDPTSAPAGRRTEKRA